MPFAAFTHGGCMKDWAFGSGSKRYDAPRVYLADPMFFDAAPAVIFKRMKTLCQAV